jgi:Delta7-sterol 5-desaturase
MLFDVTQFRSVITIFFILYGRYVVVAGIFFLVFYVFGKRKWLYRKIQPVLPANKDLIREFLYSTFTTVMFTGIGFLILHPKLLRPYTLVYREFSEYGPVYFILSLVLLLITHDTYFYWTHRAMHSKWSMKYVHRVHHQSTNPSPWAAFAFHPLEAIGEAGILLVAVFLFPVHMITIMAFMFFMTVYSVYGHLGWELYPKNFHRTWIGKWVNTSVNHNLHHKRFDGNYGLYFLFWDRVMGTLRADYDITYEEVLSRQTNEEHPK